MLENLFSSGTACSMVRKCFLLLALMGQASNAARADQVRVSGEVRERGRNHCLIGATVLARPRDQPEKMVAAETAGDCRYQLQLTPNNWGLTGFMPGFQRATKEVAVKSGAPVEQDIFLEADSNAFEGLVEGRRDKPTAPSVSVAGPELRSVPGTFGGEPFRALLTLPGVNSVVSGAGFPIVRGAAPASTGWLLDGVRLPSLFHLFVLSEVVHPRFIESIDFYPSAYPAQYGQLIGGVVDARTPTGRVREPHAEVDIDLLNTGAFVEAPVGDHLSLALAGRYSYAGLATAIADKFGNFGTHLQFWDYQARAAWQLPSNGELRLFLFGSYDSSEQDHKRVVDTTFHRADLRWTQTFADWRLTAALTAGIDDLRPSGEILWSRELDPRFLASWSSGNVAVRTGFDATWKRVVLLGQAPSLGSISTGGLGESGRTFDQEGLGRTTGLVGGAFAEVSWALGPLTLIPALRGSYFHNTRSTYLVAEPRLAARYRLDDSLVLKAGTGLYHQGPTAFLDLPAIDVAALDRGLQRAWQISLGAEKRIDSLALDVEVTTYWTESTRLYEPAIEIALDDAIKGTCDSFSCTELFSPRRGRSIGFEVMVRRRLGERLFGWVSYTASRTTRLTSNYGNLPWVFDEAHILNAAATYQLGSGWSLGLGLQFHSGRPATASVNEIPATPTPDQRTRCFNFRDAPRGDTTRCWQFGLPFANRLPPFARLDFRCEKSWLYDRHTVTAYLDVLNASASREVERLTYELGGNYVNGVWQPSLRASEVGLRLILPMIGVKGTW